MECSPVHQTASITWRVMSTIRLTGQVLYFQNGIWFLPKAKPSTVRSEICELPPGVDLRIFLRVRDLAPTRWGRRHTEWRIARIPPSRFQKVFFEIDKAGRVFKLSDQHPNSRNPWITKSVGLDINGWTPPWGNRYMGDRAKMGANILNANADSAASPVDDGRQSPTRRGPHGGQMSSLANWAPHGAHPPGKQPAHIFTYLPSVSGARLPFKSVSPAWQKKWAASTPLCSYFLKEAGKPYLLIVL